jgi:hypothetical protein
MVSGMEDDGQTYLLPHPASARVMFTLAGLFALLVPPYELLGGVWPLNATTPFFAFIMLGGMSVGAASLWAGLAAPSARLVFQEGCVEVERQYIWGARRRVIRAADLTAVEVAEMESMEGPNVWHAVIRAAGLAPIGSRPLATKAAAEKLAEVFRRKLGLDRALRR